VGDQINYGIVGDVNAENLAVGPNSRIEVTNVRQALAEQLYVLGQAVREYDGPEEARRELLAAHDELVTQLKRPEPDKPRILDRLSAIARAAGSASTIVTAVTALAGLVQAVI
jgi:hypothetical protein